MEQGGRSDALPSNELGDLVHAAPYPGGEKQGAASNAKQLTASQPLKSPGVATAADELRAEAV